MDKKIQKNKVKKLLENRQEESIELSIAEIRDANGGIAEISYSRLGAYKGNNSLPNAFREMGYEIVDVRKPDGTSLGSNDVMDLSHAEDYSVLLGRTNATGTKQTGTKQAGAKQFKSTRRRVKKGFPKLNSELPKEVQKDEKGIVMITRDNVNIIRSYLSHHDTYQYTSAVESLFKTTKPTIPEEITLEMIIARLMIINQIDGTNLTTNFGAGAFSSLAQSIKENDFESLIAKKEQIPNDKFIKVAIRDSVNVGGKQLKLFSIVTKYIARTAHYIYNNDNCYPIYDSVLGSNLEHYISGIAPSAIREECNYEEYCEKINNYLKSINQGKPEDEQISNLDFDLIVWFSYKATNAPRKYK